MVLEIFEEVRVLVQCSKVPYIWLMVFEVIVISAFFSDDEKCELQKGSSKIEIFFILDA